MKNIYPPLDPNNPESFNTWFAGQLDEGSGEQYLWCMAVGDAVRVDGVRVDAYMFLRFTQEGPRFMLFPNIESLPDRPMTNFSDEAFSNPAYFESDMGLSNEISITIEPKSPFWSLHGSYGTLTMDSILIWSRMGSPRRMSSSWAATCARRWSHAAR